MDTVELVTPLASDKMPDALSKKGVVAWRFPRWSLTKETRRASDPDKRTYQSRMMVPLAWVDEQTGFYEAPDFYDPSKTRKFSVVPIRFIRACKNGHMGDIDWCYFVHRRETDCARQFWLDDMGTTGELNESRVRCDCGLPSRSISEAHGKDNPCWAVRRSQQWLGPATEREECTEMSQFLIRTASNAYFPQKLSVISLPDRGQDSMPRLANLGRPLRCGRHNVADQVREEDRRGRLNSRRL